MELERWLRELGLEQYTVVLADNDIDLDILFDLSESDLEKLGFSLGHRRKLLKAISARAAPPQQAEPASVTPGRTEGSSGEAERRQVTVLFSDLVGFTALANTIDPEDMSGLLRRYQDCVAGAIARFDGFIAKFLGDGVLVYFGYPRAQEDAAARSVHAALAITKGVNLLHAPDGQAVKTRVGIATGLVVIGDIIGSGAARQHSIVGETPNLAARLQSIAEPNSIVISQSTHRLLGRQFDYESLGPQQLKGFAQPVNVWRVVREALVASRFTASCPAHKAPFVGRGPEMALLLDRWRLARGGEGRAVIILGEAGIGKSRLLDVLGERIGSDPHFRIICQCSAYHLNSALRPVIHQLERSIGFVAEESGEQRLAKLTEFLDASGNLGASALDLFADLLSIPHSPLKTTLDHSPAQRKAATIAALIHQLRRLADQSPVLFIVEDAHWIDPTTLEFLKRLIDGIDSARIVVLVTARPEFVSPWTARDHVATLMLNRLGKGECAELVAGVLKAGELQCAMIEEIMGKTDGVPLFIEEMTKAAVESSGPCPAGVPSTLYDSLMARLDRTGPAKDVAQIAAVIGLQFPFALLERVASGSGIDVGAGIERLAGAGLIFALSCASEESYSFKHALVRDVAYDTLLRGRRQQIHERIARVLGTEFPSVAANEPELLAQHFSKGGIVDAACGYFERAGDREAEHSNFAEAIAHFKSALGEIAKLGGDPECMRREVVILLKLGSPLTVMVGAQNPEVKEVYERCRHLANTLGDNSAIFKATWGLWFSSNIGSRLKEARDYAQELMILGERSNDPDLLFEATHCRWSTATFRGEVATMLTASQEGIKRYDAERHGWMVSVFGGHDPGVCAHGIYALALCLTGLIRQAHEASARGLSLAEQLNHLHSITHALIQATNVHALSRDYAAVSRDAERLIEISKKHNFPPMQAQATISLGWRRAVGEADVDGLELMEVEFRRAPGLAPMFRLNSALLAEGRMHFGKYPQALDLLHSVLERATEPGVGDILPEIYRLQGLCLFRLDKSRPQAAMNSLETAVETARQQGATLLQLRAAIDLANVARGTEKEEQSRQSLSGLCGSLPSQFDAPERVTAKNFLG